MLFLVMIPPAKTAASKPLNIEPTDDVGQKKTSEISVEETVRNLSLIIHLLNSVQEVPGKPELIRIPSQFPRFHT